MEVKFFSPKNIKLGLRLFLVDILTAILIILPIWFVFYLIKTVNMQVIGGMLGIGLFFFNYHIKGWWARLFGIK